MAAVFQNYLHAIYGLPGGLIVTSNVSTGIIHGKANPHAGFQITRPPRNFEIKKKLKKKLQKPLLEKLETRPSALEYSDELQRAILDLKALSEAIDLIGIKIAEFKLSQQMEAIDRMLAQQALLELQKQSLAMVVLEMEEEEHLILMMLMDD